MDMVIILAPGFRGVCKRNIIGDMKIAVTPEIQGCVDRRESQGILDLC
jgi:hypothetical protein